MKFLFVNTDGGRMHFGTNRIRAHGITLRLEDNAVNKQADSGLHRCSMRCAPAAFWNSIAIYSAKTHLSLIIDRLD